MCINSKARDTRCQNYEQCCYLWVTSLRWVSESCHRQRLLTQIWVLQKPRKRQLSCLWAGDPGSLCEIRYYWNKTAEKRSNGQNLPLFCRGIQKFIRVTPSIHCSSTSISFAEELLLAVLRCFKMQCTTSTICRCISHHLLLSAKPLPSLKQVPYEDHQIEPILHPETVFGINHSIYCNEWA